MAQDVTQRVAVLEQAHRDHLERYDRDWRRHEQTHAGIEAWQDKTEEAVNDVASNVRDWRVVLWMVGTAVPVIYAAKPLLKGWLGIE